MESQVTDPRVPRLLRWARPNPLNPGPKERRIELPSVPLKVGGTTGEGSGPWRSREHTGCPTCAKATCMEPDAALPRAPR